jgi:hypothetical protein
MEKNAAITLKRFAGRLSAEIAVASKGSSVAVCDSELMAPSRLARNG